MQAIDNFIAISTTMSEDLKDKEAKGHTASEPDAELATQHHDGVHYVNDEIDDLNWDSMPVFGAKNIDEAKARINQAWEDRNNPSKWATSEQMWNRLSKKYPWLR